MARTIKTREVVRDIKTRASNPHIGVQMKNAATKAKNAAAQQMQEPQGSPNDYAGNVVEEKAKAAAHDVVRTADHQGRKAVKQLKERPRLEVNKTPASGNPSTNTLPTDASSADAPSADVRSGGTPAERTVPDRAKIQQRKAQQKKKASQQRGKGKVDKPGASASKGESGKPNQPKRKSKKAATARQKPGRAIGRSKKAARTAAQSTRQGQQAAKTAMRSAKRAKQTAQRTRQAAQQSIKATKAAMKTTIKVVKAAVEGTKWLVGAIIAGGWVAVVIIIIVCLVGLLLASPFGIFFSGGDGEQTLPQVVRTLSNEYYDSFDILQLSYVPDKLEFDGDSMAIDWPQVLAVYAVKVTSDPLDPGEVASFDKKNIDRLRKILNEMNSFTYSVDDAQEGDDVERTLTVHITQKSATDMALAYKFNTEQKAQLDELLSPEYADMWAQLLGGYTPGSGEILQGDPARQGTDILAWPMQAGSYYISSTYGLRDNPTNPGEIKFHNGVDLAADEGVPILAAAAGIVEVANSTDSWGYGWGYYIKVRHEGGFVTLYAHCSKIAVRTDEEVEQGQVIGYVGSTGNSTGEHLHFSVYKDGKASNPLDFYTQQ